MQTILQKQSLVPQKGFPNLALKGNAVTGMLQFCKTRVVFRMLHARHAREDVNLPNNAGSRPRASVRAQAHDDASAGQANSRRNVMLGAGGALATG